MMPTPTYLVDERLKEWATQKQCEYIDAVNEHRSMRAAARALGVNFGTIRASIKLAEKKAAIFGYSPKHDLIKPAAPGFRIKGHSTAYDHRKPGAPAIIQWVKTEKDAAEQEAAIREFVNWLIEDARGKSPAIQQPALVDEDVLVVYPMGDPHFGMYAWSEEAGDDFDLNQAESLTRGAIDRLVSSAPSGSTGLLINLGDFFHADDSTGRTPSSGHSLDVDTRHAKVLQVGLRSMVHAIKRMLTRHQEVIVWMMAGNHDPHASYALALCISAFFENEPRVQVNLSPSLYKYLRFGKVLIGAHHGHGARMADLPGIMAHDRAVDWGATTHRYWYCGHVHHKNRDKEHPGVIVETFRTLAPRDAWHAGQGYRAGRDMHMIVLHKEFGEILRARCDVTMLKS